MRNVVLLTVAVLALAGAGVAGANNGNGNANKSSNGAQTGKFSRTYVNGIGGTFTCSGIRVARTGANGFTKDLEQCTISDPATFLPQGRTLASPYFVLNNVKWYWDSDFDGKLAKTITYVVSGGGPNGTAHLSIVAYY